jgi:hypothetical protein
MAGLALLLQGAVRAQTPIKIQPILKSAEMVGDLQIAAPLRPVGLNDGGQILIRASARGLNLVLLQYADGKITPIAVHGREVPGGGTWATSTNIQSGMNGRGGVIFATQVRAAEKSNWSTYLWDPASQKTTLVAQPGMPAVNDLAFGNSQINVNPQINNRDEIAFFGSVLDAAGKAQTAAFFRGANGPLQAVALPDQAVPGGGPPIDYLGTLSLTDSGAVAFRAVRQGDPNSAIGAYLWEQGTLSPAAVPGAELPGGAKLVRVTGVWLNNKNRSVLVAALPEGTPSRYGLYRLAEGKLVAVATPGQEMPGGGTLRTVLHENVGSNSGPNALGDVSPANQEGQHAFRGLLEDGTRAVYRAEADGKLSLILKNREQTDLGEVVFVAGGTGIHLNSQGQVAMAVRIAGGPETLALITPGGP